LAAGLGPLDIIDEGVMPGAKEVGERFESGDIFLPQLMMTGQAVKAAMALLGPVIQERYSEETARARQKGTVVMATVQTDIHDIGKNLVSLMLEASAFQVIDLGVDIPLKTIVAKAQEVDADIIGCSSLLTTSMPFMRDLVDLVEAMNERDRFKIMVGGASVTPAFGTAPDAAAAVRLAERLMKQEA
jgi:5-methyltetrahydrofolate--homocysteine methyltransferase